MEIGPVPGVRGLGSVPAVKPGLRAPSIFDLEGTARPGDGEVTRNERKAEGAEEDVEDELSAEEEPQRGADDEPSQKNVDFFA
jgi:hypothetical protein